MPISVDVPDLGEVEFPDSMSQDDIEKAIKTHLTSSALDVAVKSPVEASGRLLQTLESGAEGSDMGRRQIAKQSLQNEMTKTRIARDWTDALQGLAGAGESAAGFVKEMEPINLLKRTLDVPAQLGGSPLRIGPVVSPEQVRQFILPTPETPGSLGEGVAQAGSELLSGLTSPEQALALVAGKANPEAVARLFQVGAASQIPAAAQQLGQALQSGEPSEVGRAGFGLGTSVAIPALIEKGVRDAQGIRTDTGRVRETGTAPETSQETRSDDLVEQASKPQGEPISQGTTPETQRIASPRETALYLSGGTPKDLSNLPTGGTAVPQPLDGLNINGQKNVVSRVLSSLHDSKVFDSVIKTVPVDVVNNLIGKEPSSKVTLDDKSMLLDKLSSFGTSEPSVSASILRFVNSALLSPEFRTALNRTKEVGPSVPENLASLPVKTGTTELATEGHVPSVTQSAAIVKGPVAPSVTQTTPPAKEIPSGPSETGLKPAIRLVGGDVVVGEAGQTHPDIIKRDDLKATDVDQRGFVDEQGKFLDREQAATATQLPTSEPARLHSTDLPEAKTTPPAAVTEGESPTTPAASAATVEGGAAPSTGSAKAEPTIRSSTEQAPIQGMGGAVPGEFNPSQQTITGIRNARVDQERVKRGLPPAMEVVKRSFGEVWDKAVAIIDQRPEATDELIASLKSKPRALNDVEDAMLLQRQVDLQNEYAKATRDLAQAHDDGRTDAADAERLRVSYLSDKLLDLYNVGKKAGTETARGLNARRMLANEDFTLAKMELEQRAAKGGKPLTDSERAQITDLHDKIAATQKAYDDYVAQTDARLADLENKAKVAELSKQPEIPAPILQAAERLVKSLDTRADAARTRLREKMTRFSAGVDPTILVDLAEIGAAHIARVGLDFAKWSARMLEEVGGSWHKDLPSLEDVFKASQKGIDAVGQVADKVKSTVKGGFAGLDLEGKKAETVRAIKEKTKEGDMSGVSPLAQRIAKAFVAEGITDREKLIDAVHGVLADAVPGITRRQSMDAISGYGDFRPLSKDEITVKLRGLKGEMQQLSKLEDMAKGEPPLKTGIQRRTPTDAERALIKEVNDAKVKFQIPSTDPETQLQSALDTVKTTIRNRIKDLNDRIAKGDYAKKPRREVVLDDTAMRLKADLEKVKKRFQEGVDLERFKNRPTITKAADWLTKLRRWQILSSPVSLAKLTAAAALRLTTSAGEEGVGGLIGKAIPGVAERAPREGKFNVDAEVKSLHSAITQGMKDAWATLRKGRSDLDAIYGTRRAPENAFVDFWGRLHGMLKAPVKRAEFTRSMLKRMDNAARGGADITNPLVQLRIGVEAYKDANRSIFLNSNRVVDAMKSGLARLEAPDKSTGKPTLAGKAGATAARIALPIVRVPTNIVAEAMQYAFGSITGLGRLGRAYAKGIENLKPEEADLIMRSLKKGSVGAAAFTLGFLNPNVMGGYYARGEKRRSDQPAYGSIQIYGHNIPSFLLHHPLVEVAQLGATVRRVAEETFPNGEKKGIPAGLVAGALGIGEQVPFIREMFNWAKVQDLKSWDTFSGELGKSLAVPQLLQFIATKTDTDSRGNPIKRKPGTFMEHIETGIPGLRQTVPEKR